MYTYNIHFFTRASGGKDGTKIGLDANRRREIRQGKREDRKEKSKSEKSSGSQKTKKDVNCIRL